MSAVTVQWKGLDKFWTKVRETITKAERDTKANVMKAALFVQTESMKRVPVVTGNLKNSRFLRPYAGVKGYTVELGYTAIYAMSVHENPRAGKTGGVSPSGKKYTAGRLPSGKKSARAVHSTVGEWKYLENVIKDYRSTILRIIRTGRR